MREGLIKVIKDKRSFFKPFTFATHRIVMNAILQMNGTLASQAELAKMTINASTLTKTHV